MSILQHAVRRKYPVVTDRMAARFLKQSTHVYKYSDIQAIVANGRQGYQLWLDDQFNNFATKDWHGDQLKMATDAAGSVYFGPYAIGPLHFHYTFNSQSYEKLWLKVFYAVNKFFPINFTSLGSISEIATGWCEQIQPHIFGNFRDLIEAVSKTLTMGNWLTFAGNSKETATNQPDENYAREIMQLFTIGLWELNQDGSRKKTGDLDPSDSRYVLNGTDDVPTYTLADIKGLARVFTGWAGSTSTTTMQTGFSSTTARNPMVNVASFHETGEKTFLGLTIPAGTGGQASLTLALNHLFNHSSMPPYFCKAMIQYLTTSNPSPGYISRVAAAFINNGQGVRGDLKAVWKAILMDQEARSETVKKNSNWGRALDLWEVQVTPFLGLGTFTRYDGVTGTTTPGILTTHRAYYYTTQYANILQPPSVFGFYSRNFSPSSSFTSQGLVAPELQNFPENTIVNALDKGSLRVGKGGNDPIHFVPRGDGLGDALTVPTSDISSVGTNAEIAERVNLLCFGGEMSDELKNDAMTRATNEDTTVWNWTRRFLRHVLPNVELYVQK